MTERWDGGRAGRLAVGADGRKNAPGFLGGTGWEDGDNCVDPETGERRCGGDYYGVWSVADYLEGIKVHGAFDCVDSTFKTLWIDRDGRVHPVKHIAALTFNAEGSPCPDPDGEGWMRVRIFSGQAYETGVPYTPLTEPMVDVQFTQSSSTQQIEALDRLLKGLETGRSIAAFVGAGAEFDQWLESSGAPEPVEPWKESVFLVGMTLGYESGLQMKELGPDEAGVRLATLIGLEPSTVEARQVLGAVIGVILGGDIPEEEPALAELADWAARRTVPDDPAFRGRAAEGFGVKGDDTVAAVYLVCVQAATRLLNTANELRRHGPPKR